MADPTDVIATPTTTSAGTTGTTTGGDIAGKPSGVESSLSNWAGPYVTEMMGRGQAIASTPYQAYTGPLTAGTSALQNQAFTGIANLQVPASIGAATATAGQVANKAMGSTYDPTAFTTGQFTDQGVAQKYMNPYVQTALNPQIEEARRQSEIENLKNKAAATRAGAYGGSRQALMESENQRNLLQNLGLITGKGYETAYNKAQEGFMADQARALQAAQAQEQSKQFGANYGLQGLNAALQAAQTQGQLGSTLNQQQLANLAAQSQAGTTQRAIEQEGITADYGQFQEARDYPYKQVQYMQSLLQGLPLAAQSYTYNEPSTLSTILASSKGIMGLYDSLFGGK